LLVLVAYTTTASAADPESASTGKMLAEALRASQTGPASLIRVHLEAEPAIVLTGRKATVRFSVTNLTDKTVTLRVPAAQNAPTSTSAMGLPLTHVFSGPDHSALTIIDKHGDRVDQDVTRPPRGTTPEVQLAPHASVGMSVELTQYYDALRHPGTYTLAWRPYDAQVVSEPLTLTVLARQEAVLLTDFGKMRMRFFYDVAPRHVANFVELINQRFYDKLTFNRVIPGGLIQGGDPRGDRRGVRPDGKRIQAEFSNIPFEKGTVGMARSAKDPDSASCQFFITLSRQPAFDGHHTAFGQLVGEESFKTLDKIAAVSTDSNDRPVRPVYIRTISLENIPPKVWESQRTEAREDHGPAQTTTQPEEVRLGPPINLWKSDSTATRPAGATTRTAR
jgi:peptidyl-prolyl cis-trans isomerase B (cyclophilin B)